MCAFLRYEDDRDEGEWFLYTGSGGRDLSGNKRVTNVGFYVLSDAVLILACIMKKRSAHKL